jgi:hypothetical protein
MAASRTGAVTAETGGAYSPREMVLAAAARAVLGAFPDSERQRLTAPARASLRVLEAALELYADPLPPPGEPPPP